MTKKELAQKRNWFKYQLLGMIKPIDKECMSNKEKREWQQLIILRNQILKSFDSTSIEKGLNVPNKCWCNKPVYKQLKTCKEHDN